jgi:hypothetical protein
VCVACAEQELLAFKRQPAAWEQCLRLLASPNPLVVFFASETLKDVARGSWRAVAPEPRAAVLRCVGDGLRARFASLPHFARTKLMEAYLTMVEEGDASTTAPFFEAVFSMVMDPPSAAVGLAVLRMLIEQWAGGTRHRGARLLSHQAARLRATVMCVRACVCARLLAFARRCDRAVS